MSLPHIVGRVSVITEVVDTQVFPITNAKEGLSGAREVGGWMPAIISLNKSVGEE